MKRIAVGLIGFLLIAAGVTAQQCDHNLSCGRVPWDMPGFPMLVTPTRIPTVVATAFSGSVPTDTPEGTPTPLPTGTPAFAVNDLSDTVGTLQAVINSTQVVFDEHGIATHSPSDLEENSELFFGYVTGLGDAHFGVFTPLFTFVLFAIIFMIGVKALLMMLPLIAAIFGFIRRMVDIVLGFIPG